MSIRNEINRIVDSIKPLDSIEKECKDSILKWIQSGDPLFRVQKPDIPNKHLVSYFVLFDETCGKILLVDHKKAQLWLPTGGHIEVDEHPKDTVERECMEELNIKAKFWMKEPLFITSTTTVGLTSGHTDVSLWYVLKGDSKKEYQYDLQEFNDICWFYFDDIPYEKSDPEMKRFIKKMQLKLS